MPKNKKQQNKYHTLIKWGIAIVLLLFLLFGMKGCFGVGLDYKIPTGIGEYKYSFGESFRDLFTVNKIPDYVDDEGVEYCFEYDCSDEAYETYEDCLDAEAMFVGDGGFDPESECWDMYETTLFDECAVNCDEESYEWDGTEVTNVGEFYGYAFPNAVESWEFRCESFLHGGTWVQEEDRIGCVEGNWLGCDSNSVQSGGEVCEQIGYTFTCGDGHNILCEVSE